MALSPITNPVPLEKVAYDAIKEAILSFHLGPGETVVEAELARQLGISKTPVRDALSRLEKEGFVNKYVYKGYAVAEISRDDVIEIFHIRAALEGIAARQAAESFTIEELHKIRFLVSEQETALLSSDNRSASRLNREFHEMILSKAANQRLRAILDNLDDHLQRYRMLSNFQSGRLLKSVEEHRRIVEALEAHAPDRANAAIQSHLLSVLADLTAQDFEELVETVRNQSRPEPVE